MSKNINQIFTANPITSNVSTDLMYFGQSPYGAGNDAAMTFANFSSQFGAPYTASALTSVNDTNVTLTLGGTPATALLHAASLTLGWTGTLSGARGGTGVNNGSSTITLGGSLTTSGAFASTFTITNTTNVTFPTSGTLATTSQIPSLPLSISNGGTGVTSVTTSPTASAWAGWDTNSNLSSNSLIEGYTTTVTSGGTTTLTVSSSYQQYFTGSSNQTVKMPVASTLVLGQSWKIVNNSNFNTLMTIQSSGGNTILTLPPGNWANITCILTSGTTATSWSVYSPTVFSNTSNSIYGPGALATTNSTSALGIGNGANAGANSSVALGASSSAAGTSSMAIGQSASAQLNQAIALGQSTVASGVGSIAIGGNPSTPAAASATNAIAIGIGSTASRTASIALGLNALSNQAGSFVCNDGNGSGGGTSASNQWVHTFAGGFFFYQNNTTVLGKILTTGSTFIGTTTNDNASSGFIGEYVSSNIASGSAVSLTSATSANITSISLTAGDWTVYALGITNPAALTTTSIITFGISQTTNTLPTPSDTAGYVSFNNAISMGLSQALPLSTCRISLSTTTTIYLVANVTFAVSTLSAYGYIAARRMR